MTKIVSFDPGGTTGVAIWEDGKWNRCSLGPKEHHYELWQFLIRHGDADTWVYETFNYQRRDITKGVSLELISREYIGIIKLAFTRCASHWGGKTSELIPQSPPQRMFWTDDKLRELDLWVSSEHERDATRHLLYYLTFTCKDDRYLKRLKP